MLKVRLGQSTVTTGRYGTVPCGVWSSAGASGWLYCPTAAIHRWSVPRQVRTTPVERASVHPERPHARSSSGSEVQLRFVHEMATDEEEAVVSTIASTVPEESDSHTGDQTALWGMPRITPSAASCVTEMLVRVAAFSASIVFRKLQAPRWELSVESNGERSYDCVCASLTSNTAVKILIFILALASLLFVISAGWCRPVF